MPIPLEKSYVAPNAIYPPQIILQSAIVNGQIKTSARIVLRAAKSNVDGTWENVSGQTASVVIPDIANLPKDLASLSKGVQEAYAGILTMLGELNAIRKVL
jgi:hypothetical protein